MPRTERVLIDYAEPSSQGLNTRRVPLQLPLFDLLVLCLLSTQDRSRHMVEARRARERLPRNGFLARHLSVLPQETVSRPGRAAVVPPPVIQLSAASR